MGLLWNALLVMEVCFFAFIALFVHGSSAALAGMNQLQKPPIARPVWLGQPPFTSPEHAFPPTLSSPHSARKIHKKTPSPHKAFPTSTTDNSPTRVTWPHHPIRPSNIAAAPSSSVQDHTRKWVNGPSYAPSVSFPKHHRSRMNKFSKPALGPSHAAAAPTYQPKALPPSSSWSSIVPAPSPRSSLNIYNIPAPQPSISPMSSSFRTKTPPPPTIMALPPPPPNEDCGSLTCTEPLTYTPPGAQCGCVWPIQVKLSLGVPIYNFFPLVTELAKEIGASIKLNNSQVRIMGANAATQQLDESTVLINLVPRGLKFDDITAFYIYKKFWRREISINTSLFGVYEVLYVRYPGLPPSPPSTNPTITTADDGPYGGRDNHGEAVKPLGVDVPRRQRSNRLKGTTVAVIALSSFTAFVVFFGLVWLIISKRGACINQSTRQVPDESLSPSAKQSAGAPRFTRFGNVPSSTSMSFDSNAMTYTGSAKTFTLNDIERATKSFDPSRIIGEGGFGVVYRGTLDDGREVAVKVLKRDDQHGGREFLAEVEMLSRLHHRNLVKLIGICIEGNNRCLVYELIPNGSVESHLHGVDKLNSPLDWDARMKIALGAARGLAYLHEDSNPRVIHRDFKSSNILLEHDFTPKVSDFGLARTAMDEEHKHISTHVMGTFGYLAPEYAMTGHLLVKSDVYSYGVVLLELLTGRKPVDLSQPPGQENLVAWARPLLTSKEALETIMDPVIKPNISSDTVVKVAAIASMCVQPEVSHRPFMGEVVQALKLVCNEFDETTKEVASLGLSEDDSYNIKDSKSKQVSGDLIGVSEVYPAGYRFSHDNDVRISASELLNTPLGLDRQESGSFRRHSTSGPISTGRRKQFWQRLKSLSRGSMSEHGFSLRLWQGPH